ncbi:MAG: hypothetical protein R6X14_08580, partial [bacterium]
ITDLQSGVMQISVSADGTRLAFNALNRGLPDIFLIRSPFDRRMDPAMMKIMNKRVWLNHTWLS